MPDTMEKGNPRIGEVNYLRLLFILETKIGPNLTQLTLLLAPRTYLPRGLSSDEVS